MKELLQEMIDAGSKVKMPLDMDDWITENEEVCGTSCCLCGDVAIVRATPKDDHEMMEDIGTECTKTCWQG